MALDDTIPADGDGITTGVKVSELAGHIRTLKTDLNNDFATLEYVNASLAANTLNLFLTDTSSAEVGGYYEMLFSETGAGGSSLTENSVSDGETLLWSYISPQFAIADQVSAGLYIVSIWVEQDSNKTVTFAAKLYKRDSGGTETELVETSTSDTVTKDTKTQIIMSGFLENDTPISSTDRVVLKIYSNVSGGGGAPDITIYMEGTDDSRAAVRIPTSVITKKIFDADGDTYVTVEETADEDKIHFYTAGVKRATIDDSGFNTIIGEVSFYYGIGIVDPATRTEDIGDRAGDTVSKPGWKVANGNAGTPNMLNRFLRMESTSGNTGGEDTHVLTSGEMPSHSHKVFYRDRTKGAGTTGFLEVYAEAGSDGYKNSDTAGSGNAHENKPAYYSLIPIIKMS